MVEKKSQFAVSDLKEDMQVALNKVKADDALDLCIILDITASMGKWIERSKATITTIIDNVMKSVFAKQGLYIRLSFVGYRDFGDQHRFNTKGFTEDIQQIRNFIGKQIPNGGIDFQEDVSGGLKKCMDMDWDKDALKQACLICDAPEHGMHFLNDMNDRYKRGTPNKDTVEDLMHEMAEKGINFTVCRLDDSCDQMIATMGEHYNVRTKEQRTKDLADQTANQEERKLQNEELEEEIKEYYANARQKLREEHQEAQAERRKEFQDAFDKRKQAQEALALKEPVIDEVGQFFAPPIFEYVDVVSHIRKHFPEKKQSKSNNLNGFDKEARGNQMLKSARFEESVQVPMTPGQLRKAKEDCTDKFFIKQFSSLLLSKLKQRADRRREQKAAQL